MAITNGYCTLAEARLFMEWGSDTTHDADIERAVEAASRAIDSFTGRRFYQEDATVKTYSPEYPDLLLIDDLRNTTGLTVKTDTSGDGTYDTTWTITTDFIMDPPTPRPGYPYTAIRISRAGSRLFPLYPAAAEVTGNYGWDAIPMEVEQACLHQTNFLVARRNSPEGVAGFTEFGVARVRKGMDPTAADLLEPFRKHLVAF